MRSLSQGGTAIPVGCTLLPFSQISFEVRRKSEFAKEREGRKRKRECACTHRKGGEEDERRDLSGNCNPQTVGNEINTREIFVSVELTQVGKDDERRVEVAGGRGGGREE